MADLQRRRDDTAKRTEQLQARLAESEKLILNAACVYSTGSFGRREAGIDSDLDLFIVSKLKEAVSIEEKSESRLRRLDEICLKADLIKQTKAMGIKEFDGDGRYLVHYTIEELKSKLGKPEDDALNTFTARLLLLLESTPLLGSGVYKDIVDDVIAAYWQDFEDHQDDFVPAFLANDILRLWRTFCVNYEVRTEREPEEKNIKRRKKNYTLKHSRLLTCYSGLLYLLSTYEISRTVSPTDVRKMVALSPTERLEWMLSQEPLAGARAEIERILEKYNDFLIVKSDPDLFHSMFATSEVSRKSMKSSYEFAELVFDAIEKVGNRNRLHKLLLV